jgi:class 3 adenylate cyclase
VSSPLVAVLQARGVVLSAESLARGRRQQELSPFDRAALETLGVPVVVPVRLEKELVLVLCLGSKRSGDVYTSSDMALLAALADKLSAELLRFDQDEILRQARDMQETLRRYVPGALVDELSEGRHPVEGQREVSVLFVDIRGYSRFSEDRSSAEIFSTVNRYTKCVSEIVRKHGGSVVEFNGDGMMALFGAPRVVAGKERAATQAGREIVCAVAALPVDGGGGLEVGVGVATGEAFVGNIQAADRLIWSAVGNTTNLAARLQDMTRELDAAMIVDAATWTRAGETAEGFCKKSATLIRGRRATEDVYVLPVG